jgi:hypothetical protein
MRALICKLATGLIIGCLPCTFAMADNLLLNANAAALEFRESSRALQDDSVLETPVLTGIHPIWQIDTHVDHASEVTASVATLSSFGLGYIADDYGVASVSREILTDAVGSIRDPLTQNESEFGLRLPNGWSLHFTYESLDTSLALAPASGPTSIGPLYEGPMLSATLKFR